MSEFIQTHSAFQLAQEAERLAKAKRFPAAIALMHRAIALDPLPLWISILGNFYWQNRQPDRAKIYTSRAVRLSPDNWACHYNAGSVAYTLKDFEAANFHLRRAAELNPQNPGSAFDLGLTLLQHGHLQEGFALFETRVQQFAEDYPERELPQWDGKSETALWVISDQGLGDIIQFSRYLPMLAERVSSIVLDVPTSLYPFFAAQPGLKTVRHYEHGNVATAPSGVDTYTYLSSLPHIFKTTKATIPPPLPWFKETLQGAKRAKFPITEKPSFKVGICWAGGAAHAHNSDRSVALEHFLPLCHIDNVMLYSLQAGPRALDITPVGAEALVHDLRLGLEPVLMHQWMQTALDITNLDLVVTVDTSVAHMSASLGVPTWILLPMNPDWRWGLNTVSTPWYPSMRLFRQTETLGWPKVIHRLANELDITQRQWIHSHKDTL